jgi:prepilin-type processing-associated H-X9-DG protein
MNTVNYYMNWSWYLQQCGYTKIGDVYRCPNNLKVNSSYYNTYGFRSFGFFNSKAWVTRTPENTFILVDSLESKTQIAAIYSASSPGDEKYINLRHNRLANVSYMDGHAEPVGMKGLSKIGISAFHINQDY